MRGVVAQQDLASALQYVTQCSNWWAVSHLATRGSRDQSCWQAVTCPHPFPHACRADCGGQCQHGYADCLLMGFHQQRHARLDGATVVAQLA